jgi:ABC-type polysaccharide/polyol phosphate export permease
MPVGLSGCVSFKLSDNALTRSPEIGIGDLYSDLTFFSWLFKINPMYYIITGYRDAIYGRRWFFERGTETLYFWFWAIVVFVLGNMIYRRLRIHFADVL